MGFWNEKNIDRVWAEICKHEGEAFYTVRRVRYNYVVKDGYLLVNNDPRRRITKIAIERALKIDNPTPSKIEQAGIWAPSYIYGIITDSRIV